MTLRGMAKYLGLKSAAPNRMRTSMTLTLLALALAAGMPSAAADPTFTVPDPSGVVDSATEAQANIEDAVEGAHGSNVANATGAAGDAQGIEALWPVCAAAGREPVRAAHSGRVHVVVAAGAGVAPDLLWTNW